jgi:hypothetical protein
VIASVAHTMVAKAQFKGEAILSDIPDGILAT